MINRSKVTEEFMNYVSDYDITDSKIRLKVEHTTRVAEICNIIAADLGLTDYDVDLAWVLGMLHDIGRFEQIRRYNTFNDADSVDHAQFGADLLFIDGLLGTFVDLNDGDNRLIEIAIRNHNAYTIAQGLSERELTFCKIIRDADKIDILRANSEFTLEEVYNVSTYDVRNSIVSDDVMKAFDEEHAVLRNLKKTAPDYRVGIISLMYELEYPISYKVLLEQNYYRALLEYDSDNDITIKQFEHIRKKMIEYINTQSIK